jgi:hypothetical protein
MAVSQPWPDWIFSGWLFSCKRNICRLAGHAGTICRPTGFCSMMRGALS